MTSVVAALVATACSSSASSGASSAAPSAQKPSASASASASAKPQALPKPTAPPPPTVASLKCPDEFYQNEDPPYCLKLEQARPGRAQPDGPWFTQSVGAGASLSTSRTKSVEDTVKDERAQWGTDELKERSKYTEEVDAGRTILKFKRFDPKDDPKAAEAKDVVIVVAKSVDATLRCEVYGDMSPPSVCLSMVVPH